MIVLIFLIRGKGIVETSKGSCTFHKPSQTQGQAIPVPAQAQLHTLAKDRATYIDHLALRSRGAYVYLLVVLLYI